MDFLLPANGRWRKETNSEIFSLIFNWFVCFCFLSDGIVGLWGTKRPKKPNRSTTTATDTVTDTEVMAAEAEEAIAAAVATAARWVRSLLKRHRSSLTDRQPQPATTNTNNSNNTPCSSSSMSYRLTIRRTNGPALTASTASSASRKRIPTATSRGNETITVSPIFLFLFTIFWRQSLSLWTLDEELARHCHLLLNLNVNRMWWGGE